MKKLCLLITFLGMAVLLSGAEARKPGAAKSGAAKKAPAAQSSSRGANKKSAKAKVASSKRGATQTWRSGQRQPAPERYAEIQRALVAKGFFNGQATGAWGAESVEALKRFQTAQGLKADGKIDSLSLIALGLGPQRASNSQQPKAGQ